MPSMKSGSSFPTSYEDFVTLLDDFSLVQMVTEPTRGENVLDLFLTCNPTLVNDVTVSPGIADHNVVIADVLVKFVMQAMILESILVRKSKPVRS